VGPSLTYTREGDGWIGGSLQGVVGLCCCQAYREDKLKGTVQHDLIHRKIVPLGHNLARVLTAILIKTKYFSPQFFIYFFSPYLKLL
jgi:hypothetical protein